VNGIKTKTKEKKMNNFIFTPLNKFYDEVIPVKGINQCNEAAVA
jgi:hypothetical protein